MDAKHIRGRAEAVLHYTKDAAAHGGFWVGEKAKERRALDALSSGRLQWAAAKNHAQQALDALDAGDTERALLLVRGAETLELAARRAAMQPKDVRKRLDAAPGLRGAPSKAKRDTRLAKAVSEQDIGGKAARAAALKADPELWEEFQGKRDSTVRQALNRGKKLPRK